MYKGKNFIFHGSFNNKSDAVKKEKNVPGSFILDRKIRGSDRYLVLTTKEATMRKRTHRRHRRVRAFTGHTRRHSLDAKKGWRHRRRYHRRVGANLLGMNINTKLGLDILLAYLIVAYAPGEVAKLFKLSGLSETSVDALGGLTGLVIGKIMKKPDLVTASIFIALASMVLPHLTSLLPGSTTTQPATSTQSATQTQAFLRIQDYTNFPVQRNKNAYVNDYAMN